MSKCTATNRQGNQCGRNAMAGLTVCDMHGGKAPAAVAKSKRFLAERRARESLADMEVAAVGDPLEAFADITAEAVALKDFLAGKVNALRSLETTAGSNSEQLRAVVSAYERAMDRAGKFLGEWVRLGLDERRVAL